MKSYFWIFALVCVAYAQDETTPAPPAPPRSDADLAMGITIDTISVANKVIDEYGSIATKMHSAQFDKILPEFDKYSHDYSGEASTMVGSIKTNIMNTIDAHFQASRRMSEWCSLNVPMLRTHAQLYTDYSPTKAKTQHFLLRKVLGDGIQRMNEGQIELDKMAGNIDASNETLFKLFDKFNIDFDEKSEFFQTKIRQNTKSNRLMDKFRKEKEKVTNELKGQFAKVVGFFTNIKHLIFSTLIDIKAMVYTIKPEVPIFENLKSKADKLTNFDTVLTTDPKFYRGIVGDTQNLIAKCTEYAENHKADNLSA